MPSTVIKTFSYDETRRELHITFVTARQYIYEDVPADVYAAMRSAFAKGSFFNREIRNRYRARELT